MKKQPKKRSDKSTPEIAVREVLSSSDLAQLCTRGGECRSSETPKRRCRKEQRDFRKVKPQNKHNGKKLLFDRMKRNGGSHGEITEEDDPKPNSKTWYLFSRIVNSLRELNAQTDRDGAIECSLIFINCLAELEVSSLEACCVLDKKSRGLELFAYFRQYDISVIEEIVRDDPQIAGQVLYLYQVAISGHFNVTTKKFEFPDSKQEPLVTTEEKKVCVPSVNTVVNRLIHTNPYSALCDEEDDSAEEQSLELSETDGSTCVDYVEKSLDDKSDSVLEDVVFNPMHNEAKQGAEGVAGGHSVILPTVAPGKDDSDSIVVVPKINDVPIKIEASVKSSGSVPVVPAANNGQPIPPKTNTGVPQATLLNIPSNELYFGLGGLVILFNPPSLSFLERFPYQPILLVSPRTVRMNGYTWVDIEGDEDWDEVFINKIYKGKPVASIIACDFGWAPLNRFLSPSVYNFDYLITQPKVDYWVCNTETKNFSKVDDDGLRFGVFEEEFYSKWILSSRGFNCEDRYILRAIENGDDWELAVHRVSKQGKRRMWADSVQKVYRPPFSLISWFNWKYLFSYTLSDAMCLVRNDYNSEFLIDVEIKNQVFEIAIKSQLTGNWLTMVQKEVTQKILRKYETLGVYNSDEILTLIKDTIRVCYNDLVSVKVTSLGYVQPGTSPAIQINALSNSFGIGNEILSYKFIIVGALMILGIIVYSVLDTSKHMSAMAFSGFPKNESFNNYTYIYAQDHRELIQVQGESPTFSYWWSIPVLLLILFGILYKKKKVVGYWIEEYVGSLESGTPFEQKSEVVPLERLVQIKNTSFSPYQGWLGDDTPPERKPFAVVKESGLVDDSVGKGTVNFACCLASEMNQPCETHPSLIVMSNRATREGNLNYELAAQNWGVFRESIPKIFDASLCDQIHLEHQDYLSYIDKIAKKMPWKGRLYRAEYEKLRKQDNKKKFGRIKLQIKLDEHLMTEKSSPRAIFALPPSAAVYFGPYVDIVTKRIKIQWGPDLDLRPKLTVKYLGQDCLFFPVWSPGLTYLETGSLMDYIRGYNGNIFGVFLAGDDTIVHAKLNGKVLNLESDYSKYDQSQTSNYNTFKDHTNGVSSRRYDGPLANSLYAMNFMGVPNEVLQELMDLYHDPVTMEYRDKAHPFSRTIKFLEDDCFPTGSPATTFNNTVNNAFFWFTWLQSHREGDFENSILAHADKMGFKIKLTFADDISKLTFLKGRFVIDEYSIELNNKSVHRIGYVWHPDPGVTLKFGHCKNHPRTLYPDIYRKNGKTIEAEKLCVKQYLRGVATGWAFYPETPILRSLINKYGIDKSAPIYYDFTYKPSTDVQGFKFIKTINPEVFYDWYDATATEFSDFEKKLLSAPDLFIITDPMIKKLQKLYS